ncbi:MAG: non-heme iron oxygenase ferredoxin subunit [Gammaproteobacteria bacterium]|nr:non-heme iron oxygenase ferredoxin subunit [Gammaproteobacteria bacterium]
MSEWTDVAGEEEIAPGKCRVVEVDGTTIAVFNLDGHFHAIEDVCTHDGGELASGCVYGDEIECPRHGARFRITTGEVTAPPAYEAVDVFPVRIHDGRVQVRDDRWE